MNDCIFCEILAGRAEVSLVYQDERCAAFLDIRPVTPGHLLVIPRRHAAYLAELPEEDGEPLFRVGQRLAGALRRSGLRCEGVNFFLADGEAAGQEIFHVHLHVIPRYEGDGFGLRVGHHFPSYPPRAELDETARKIREAI